MDIKTKTSSKNLQKENIIHFPEGLIGFESLKNYRIFSSETETDLHWLKPVDDNQIEFAVTFPQVFQVNYEISLDDEEETRLDIEDEDELIVFVTLSRNPNPQENQQRLNANFIAPIIINSNKKLGLQKILNRQENAVTITMKG